MNQMEQGEQIARKFAEHLSARLTPEQRKEVLRLNQAEATRHRPMVCHTHDFCNPNDAMDAALTESGIDRNKYEWIDMHHFAWCIAKRNAFWWNK